MFLDLPHTLVIRHHRLTTDAYLGRGSFGSVYSGLLDGRLAVAVKYLEPKDPRVTGNVRAADLQIYKVTSNYIIIHATTYIFVHLYLSQNY